MRSPLVPLAASLAALLACGGRGGAGASREQGVRIDQVGYAPGAVKRAVVLGSATSSFELRDAGSGAVVKTGALSPEKPAVWSQSNQRLQVADFSDVTAPGRYVVAVEGMPPSAAFPIAGGLLRDPARAVLKGFYYARASTALLPEHAGAWARWAGHPDDDLGFREAAPSDPTVTSWSAPRGWYDAGDYGKYVVNGGITVGTLLAFEELYPGAIGDDTGIPESGNGESDLLDEVKWELDWFEAMQDGDGGVFFKIAGEWWPPREAVPAQDLDRRYVIGKSTTSTLDFAAALAQAARLYRGYGGSDALADRYLAAAKRAIAWAEAHPSVRAPADTTSSGPYDDTGYADEFAWAAAELFATTGDAAYLAEPHLASALASVQVDGAAWWQDVGNLALYTLATSPRFEAQQPAKALLLRAALRGAADAGLAAMATNAYGYPGARFDWGSAGALGNAGVMFLYARRSAEGDARRAYLDAAVRLADQVLGANAVDRSFVTGVGLRPPMFPHHRPSIGDGIVAPVPGLVVGGPNQDQNDLGAEEPPTYSDSHPAMCYADQVLSWASNEPAINQSAGVFFLLAALDAELAD